MPASPDSTVTTFAMNPRETGHNTYELFHFLLENTFKMENLKQSGEEKFFSNEELAIVHFVSYQKTGLLHEVLTLLKSGIIKIDSQGFVDLSENWSSKVHPIILKDMCESGWSSDLDPSNKFCIHHRIRDGLSVEWSKTTMGFTNKDSSITHFDHDYEVKRDLFENRFEAFLNEQEGIAKFGI